MATAQIAPNGKFQGFDNNGDPLAGGKLYTYATGTVTPLATYTTSALDVANANPIVLDSRGEASVWLTGATGYKFTLKTSADVEIWTVDGINAGRVRAAATIVANAGDTVITVPSYSLDGSMVVCVNGLEQERGVAYTETDTTHITFTEALQANDRITLKYL